MKPWLLAYVGAAVAEIAGCFAFWAWLRLDKPVFWLVPGVLHRSRAHPASKADWFGNRRP